MVIDRGGEKRGCLRRLRRERERVREIKGNRKVSLNISIKNNWRVWRKEVFFKTDDHSKSNFPIFSVSDWFEIEKTKLGRKM